MKFDKVWLDVIKTIEKNNEIITVGRGQINKVIDIAEEGLMVVTTGDTELVQKEWIKAAWETLVENGSLRRDDIPGPGRFRSSFIVALLSRLEYVRVETHPIKLYLSKELEPEIVYNKLVRDKILEIIEESGRKCEVRRLDGVEYLNKLNEKLLEELKEYYEDGSLEELADLVEVIYAIVEYKATRVEEFEKIRLEKREKRGAFKEKLLLSRVYG